MPYEPIPCIFCICCCFLFPKFWLHPILLCDLVQRHAGLVLIFISNPILDYVYVPWDEQLEVCLFLRRIFSRIHMECYKHTVLSVVDPFLACFSSVNFQECFWSENLSDIVSVSYMFEIFWETFHIWDVYCAYGFFFFFLSIILRFNSWVNKTLGIVIKLKIMF
jgi:hypothetical protein